MVWNSGKDEEICTTGFSVYFSGRAKALEGSWLRPAKSAKSQFQGIEEWKAKFLISCSLQRKFNSRSGSRLYLSERGVRSTCAPFSSMRRGRPPLPTPPSPSGLCVGLEPSFTPLLTQAQVLPHLMPCPTQASNRILPGLRLSFFSQGSGAFGSRQQLPLGLLPHSFHWDCRTAGFGHGNSIGK